MSRLRVLRMLRELVTKLLAEREGGTEYFDALDAELRTPEYFALLTAFYLKKHAERPRIVVTGGFGAAYQKWASQQVPDLEVLALPSVNRKSRLIVTPELPEAFNKTYSLLDDSYYAGRTAQEVLRILVANQARLDGTYVLYDGSVEKRPLVFGIYRYHEEN